MNNGDSVQRHHVRAPSLGPAQELVSIVIPTCNRRRLLMETLRSIRAQTYGRWEAIVVDDGSTDGTDRQLTRMMVREPRIRYLRRSGKTSGASACRNLGFTHAAGEYVIFLDSDDCLAPWCLRQRVQAMQQHPDLDFAVFPVRLFKRRFNDLPLMWNRFTAEDDLDRLLRLDPPWGTEGPIWRKRALVRLVRTYASAIAGNRSVTGPWDSAAKSWQDWELNIRAVAAGLRYRKFSTFDGYHRVSDGRETITNRSWTREHIDSRRKLLARLHAFLDSRGALNDRRQKYLAALYFFQAEITRWTLSSKDAVRFWTACPHRQLIPQPVYSAVLFYFRWSHLTRMRQRIRPLLVWQWPWLEMVGRSPSHLKTPAEELRPEQQQALARSRAARGPQTPWRREQPLQTASRSRGLIKGPA